MQAVILNGAFAGDDICASVEAELASAFAGRGWGVECLRLRELTIAYCKGCFGCWVKTPGICPTRDDAGAVTRSFVRSDLAVLLTPVVFGGYSSELKKALDRSAGIVLPFFTRIDGQVHHKPRYRRYPALLAIGVVDGPDATEQRIFRTLVGRNAINFHAPAHDVAFVRRGESPDAMRATILKAVVSMTVPRRGAA
jgi:multimeric flavodoxin WrbA